MFSLKELFDLSLDFGVRMETKIIFAFHPDIVFSPFAWPRHILDRIIDDNLAYMEPRATDNQMSLVNTLREMKNRPTFEEQWPEKFEQEFVKGRTYQERLDRIRQEQYRLEDIYSQDKELYNWWKR